MPLDLAKLRRFRIPDAVQAYGERDCILYALGAGLGMEPADPGQLRYVQERGLAAFPTLACALAQPGFWQRDPAAGLDWVQSLHGEHQLRILRPLPTRGRVRSTSRITRIFDRGPGKGAIVVSEKTLVDADTDTVFAVTEHTNFCRGDGGFGGGDPPPAPRPAGFDRPPDAVCELKTSPQAALLYRLSGDMNPLHVDPDVARQAGFERPILHGLASFAVAAHAVLKTYGGHEPHRLKSFGLRFCAPVFPGETLRTEMWRAASHSIRFRASVVERQKIVLSHGTAELDG